jgi:hypothetical protein
MAKMAGDDDQPATQGALRAVMGELRGEIGALGTELRGEIGALRTELRGEIGALGTELRGEIGALGTELRGEMRNMEKRIITELGGVIQRAMNIAVEQIGSKVGVVDEKYQDLPGRVSRLEHDVDDLKLPRHPPVPPRKRPARSR